MQETITIPDDVEMEVVGNCDLCGADSFRLWDSARSNSLMQCNSCGLVFTSPRIADSRIKDGVIYAKAYFQQKSRMTDKLIDARRRSYQMEIDALGDLARPGNILDVGCGMGVFLECFSDEWTKYGCDVSSYALEEAEKRGLKVFQGEFENLDFEDMQFDIVYFRASLHHSYSPRKCIAKAYEVLKPGGVVAIAMSNNRDGMAGRFFRAHVKSYEQAHNYLFSTMTLEKYFSDAGFTVLSHNYPYWGTGYESYMDFIRFGGLALKYIYLRAASKMNTPGFYDFASPAFCGNYINIYARKGDVGEK